MASRDPTEKVWFRRVYCLVVVGTIVSLAIRFRRVIYWCVAVAFVWFGWLSILLGAFGFHALDMPAVYAQTNTPTPTATLFSTPTPTPSPVGSPTLVPGTPTPPALGSTVMFWCYLRATDNEGNGAGAAPVCSWGKSFYMSNSRHKQTGDGRIDNIDTNYDRVILKPPSSTKEVTVVCHSYGQAYSVDRGTGGAGASSRVSFDAGVPPYIVTKKNGSLTLSDNLIQVNFTQGSTFDAVDTIVWRLEDAYAAWPGSDVFPSSYGEYVNHVGLAIRSSASANGHASNESLGVTSLECEVTLVKRLDGSEYVPGDPVPLPTVTPTTDWSMIPWVPITDPVNAPAFSYTLPITETCYEILPGVEVLEVEPVNWCLKEWAVGLRYFGIDLALQLSIWMLLAAAGVLVSIWKRA